MLKFQSHFNRHRRPRILMFVINDCVQGRQKPRWSGAVITNIGKVVVVHVCVLRLHWEHCYVRNPGACMFFRKSWIFHAPEVHFRRFMRGIFGTFNRWYSDIFKKKIHGGFHFSTCCIYLPTNNLKWKLDHGNFFKVTLEKFKRKTSLIAIRLIC